MSTPPSKKEFVDLLNLLLGNGSMNEEKLELIMTQAKQVYDQQGPSGLFLYMQKLFRLPVDERVMATLWKQLQKPEGVKHWLKQVNELKKG